MSWFSFGEKKKKDAPPLPPGYRVWPKTYVIENPSDANLCGIVVRDSCVTPGGARMSDVLMSMAGLVAGFDMVILSIEVGTPEFFVGAMAGVAAFAYGTRWFLRWLFARSFWIRIFGDRVEIADWRDFHSYEARVGYTFRLEEHEKGLDEDMRYRQNPQTGRYFSNSYRFFFEHGRQPVPVLEIYPKEKGRQLLGRVNDIQHGFDIGSFQ